MGISEKVLTMVTDDVVFLTKAKRELFPGSTIQARGYLGAGTAIRMEKRLIWLSPVSERWAAVVDEATRAKELADGKRTVKTWLGELAEREFSRAVILIAGGEDHVSGELPELGREGNWEMRLEFRNDGAISVDYWFIPDEVMNRMSEARPKPQSI